MKAKGKTPPKPKAKEPTPQIVREQKEAARLLGITDRGLRDWMKKPGFPDWSAGYNVDAIRAWADDLRLKGSLESEAEAEIHRQLEIEKLEQERIKTLQLRHKLAVQEHELLPRRGWELFAATLMTSLGDWCEQLPDIIAGVCTDDCREGVRKRLADELDDRRDDLREEFDRKLAELNESEGAA